MLTAGQRGYKLRALKGLNIMTEILWAVIIGGAIGVIGSAVTSIPSLIYNHYHWKKEFNLQNLITVRTRREKQCDRMTKLLDKAIDETPYPPVLDGMWIRLPQKQRKLLNRAIKDIDRNQPEGKQKLRHKISFILGAYLGEIDKQIEELTR